MRSALQSARDASAPSSTRRPRRTEQGPPRCGRARRRWLTGLIAVALIPGPGCSFSRPFAALDAYALDLTRGVGRAQDQILLLNIVRSMHRYPQHWTSITLARGVEGGKIGAGLAVPFGGDALNQSVVTPSAEYSKNPSFDLGVLSSSEFTRGILQPASLEQVKYLLDQGWPVEFVFSLLVREIREWQLGAGEGESGAASQPVRYENRPDPENGFEGLKAFQAEMKALLAKGIRIEEREGEIVWSAPQAGLDDLVEAHKAGLQVSLKEGGTKAGGSGSKASAQAGLVVRGKPGLVLLIGRGAEGREEKRHAWLERQGMNEQQSELVALAEGNTGVERAYQFTFRSAEGLVYYLGEVMRARELVGPTWGPTYEQAGETFALFSARRAERGEQGLVNVTFEGVEYLIPKDETGLDRSMMTFTLATLMINLNKERKDLPSTGTVLSLPSS